MDEAKFTSGPWSHTYCAEAEGFDVGPPDGTTPVATVWLTDDACTSVAEATANLIAAAPDLYAVAAETLRWIEEDTWIDLDELSDELKAILAQLKAALAKARGEVS